MRKAISARVTTHNNPESDSCRYVWHTVTDSVGKVHQIYASDPMDAIKQFNQRMKDAENTAEMDTSYDNYKEEEA